MNTLENMSLREQILHLADYYAVYERYQPDEAALTQIRARQLNLHVRVYHTSTCGECARYVPALARIAEYLPGWTWELISDDEAGLTQAECGLSTPISVVSDSAGTLLGTITGAPLRGSLEADLLHITGTSSGK